MELSDIKDSAHSPKFFNPSREKFAGIIMLIGKSFSVLIVGMIITKFKPPPRGLMATNVIIGILCAVMQLSFILISCEQPQVAGHWTENHR